MMSFAFGGHERERLQIAVAGYERPTPCGDDHDDNWLTVHVTLQCGAFEGRFDAAFLTHELQSFHVQLQHLYRTLVGTAQLRTLEGQLQCTATGDGRGHVRITGVATDEPGGDRQLAFALDIDQTQLHASLQSLASVLQAFPVRH